MVCNPDADVGPGLLAHDRGHQPLGRRSLWHGIVAGVDIDPIHCLPETVAPKRLVPRLGLGPHPPGQVETTSHRDPGHPSETARFTHPTLDVLARESRVGDDAAAGV